MALGIGFVIVAALGIVHHFMLCGLDWLTGDEKRQPNTAMVVGFIGLLLIHTLEILAFAGIYRLLLDWSWMGGFKQDFDHSWSGLIYFSGINFTTLGYTQIDTTGPIRMVNMMQSLGGFMILTWSATFMYSAWDKAFKRG